MSEDFDSTLSGVISLAADAARPPGPAAARTRGRQRTVRKRLIISTTSLALIIAGTGVALATGVHPKAGTPMVTTGSPTATAGPSSPAPQSASPSTSATSSLAAAPSLALNPPAFLAAGTLNPISFTVANSGAARTVTVAVEMGVAKSATPNSTEPDETGVVNRRSPVDGSWISLPVTYEKGFYEIATYQLTLPAGQTVTERLQIIPVGAVGTDTTVKVSLSGGSLATVSRSSSLPLRTPAITVTGPTSAAQGSTPVFDFTLKNATLGSYGALELNLEASAFNTAEIASCNYSFATAQWLDNGTWQTISLGVTTASPFETIPLSTGQTVDIKVRLTILTSQSCANQATVRMVADTSSVNAGFQSGAVPGMETEAQAALGLTP